MTVQERSKERPDEICAGGDTFVTCRSAVGLSVIIVYGELDVELLFSPAPSKTTLLESVWTMTV